MHDEFTAALYIRMFYSGLQNVDTFKQTALDIVLYIFIVSQPDLKKLNKKCDNQFHLLQRNSLQTYPAMRKTVELYAFVHAIASVYYDVWFLRWEPCQGQWQNWVLHKQTWKEQTKCELKRNLQHTNTNINKDIGKHACYTQYGMYISDITLIQDVTCLMLHSYKMLLSSTGVFPLIGSPSGVQAGAGKVNQSMGSHTSRPQSDDQMLTLRSPLQASHSWADWNLWSPSSICQVSNINY